LFYDRLVAEFTNPMDVKIAIPELNYIEWNSVLKYIIFLYFYFAAIFYYTGINN